MRRINFSVFTYKIESEVVERVIAKLKREFKIDVSVIGELKPPVEAFNYSRGQYDAYVLISLLDRVRDGRLAIWMIPYDIYVQGFNFVFGLANPYSCAVLSVARLGTVDLICKEAVHETGHIFGLKHCKDPCVMAYSNSLFEASKKSDSLCEECREILDKAGFY